MNEIIYIGAFRHSRNGVEMQLLHLTADELERVRDDVARHIDSGAFTRTDLLAVCATSVWGHLPPADAIVAYATGTQAYQNVDLLGHNMIVLNFYEDDPDQPGTFSSRQSMTFSVDDQEEAAQRMRFIGETHSISPSTHSIKDRTAQQTAKKAKRNAKRKAAKKARRKNRK